MVYELYCITNKVNNKKYIGQTKSSKGYKKRFNEHKQCALDGNKSCLYFAMRKYGVENFTIKLLIHNIPKDKIDWYEQLWITKLNTYYKNHSGYNMTIGGSGTSGYIFTEEVRHKMSNASKLMWKNMSEEEYINACKRRSDNMRGRKFSEEHKRHISESAKLRVGDKNPFFGKHHSKETKDKISTNNSKKVGMFSLTDGSLIREFPSIYSAVEFLIDTGVTKNKNASSRISKICRGQDKSAYGYIWRFL